VPSGFAGSHYPGRKDTFQAKGRQSSKVASATFTGFAGADPAQEQLPGHLGHPPTTSLGLLDQPVAGVDAVEAALGAVVDQGVGTALNR
jgi:hypothetical protein